MASRRLLLVEDSSTMRRMLATMLKEEGYEVETANDGLQGLAKARLEPQPELILTDYEMPELDGAGLCRAVKADKELRSIPVLMLTTLGEAQSKIAGLEAGADDYIEKPKGQEEFRVLCARINAHLRIADLNAELIERNRLLEAAHKKLTFELDLARKVQFALMPRPPSRGGCFDWRSDIRRRINWAAISTIFTGWRTIVWESWWRTSPATASTRRCSREWSRRWPPRCRSPCWSRESCWPGWTWRTEQYFPEGYFCTGFYLIADEETGLVRYAGVGHPPAIVVGPNGPRTLPSNPGMLGIGMVDGTAGSTDRLDLGESLVIYTDGLTDAMDASDALFGEDRLKTLLQSHYGADPAEILNQVDDALDKHTRPDARRMISTSSFSNISPSKCSPSHSPHVKLVRMVGALWSRPFVRSSFLYVRSSTGGASSTPAHHEG